MTTTTQKSPPRHKHSPKKAVTLALRLAHAENALQALSSGQVDAIVGPSGKTYLLHGAQEDLRQSEMGLQALFNSASDLITVINRGGTIVSQNSAANRLLGWEAEELVGKSFFEFVHADDLMKVRAAFFCVIDGFGDDTTVDFRHLTGGNSYRTFEGMVSKVRDVTVSRIVLICRDTSGRRPRQAEWAPLEGGLTEAPQSKQCFLALLSHELRTLLMSILLGIDEMQEDERFAQARPIFTMIRRNIELQSRLIEQLTDFTERY